LVLIKNLLLNNKKSFWRFTDTELKDLDDQEDDYYSYLWGQFGERGIGICHNEDDTSLAHQGKIRKMFVKDRSN
jgi:hypothetical protein